MKIKFLSFIASFFIVPLITMSCLDSDNEVEYSSDATIHAFAIDTIGYGKTYKFTIDQVKGEIYNEDSLPVHADTIIDRILIKTLTTSSGLVSIKTQDGKTDSLLNISDSINLTKYINPTSKDKCLELKVFAPDMQASKLYYLSIRKHKHDPDSLKWQYEGSADNNITGLQRSIVFKNQIFTYTVPSGSNSLKVYMNAISAPNAWVPSEVTVSGNTKNVLPASIITFGDKLYATFKGDINAYVSTDGVNWDVSSLSNVVLFLAPIQKKFEAVEEKISYIKKEGDKYIFCTSTNGATEDYKNYDLHKESLSEEAMKKFPNFITSYTNYENRNGSKGAMLIGEAETSTTITKDKEDIAISVTWGYAEETMVVNKLDENGNAVMNGNENVKESITISRWADIPAGSSYSYCPEMKNPTIVYYNSQFYLFGDGFDSFYTSLSGRDWKKANKKFSFPNLDWAKAGTAYSTKTPEFRGRTKFSMVLDTERQYMIFIFGKNSNISIGENKTYSHDSEVWRARLNQLWFDLDPANAGK